ncbi:MAG: hypothetical protein Kow0047_22670 [Anaerolineae bacterium]
MLPAVERVAPQITRDRLSALTRWALAWAGLCIVLALFIAHVVPALAANDWATDDEIAYLNGGLEIHERWGGVAGLLGAMLRAEFTRSERGPLYMALLSTFARRDLSMFDRARWVNLWIGMVAILLLYVLIWRWHRPAYAFAVCTLLATGPDYINSMAVVGAEVVFVPLIALTLLTLDRGLDHPRWWVVGFGLMGVSYLAKSNGFFLIVPALIAWAVRHGRSAWRARALWLGLLVFLLIGSPLFIRNWRMEGNPLYNANTRLMWIDEYEVSRTDAFREAGASLAGYLRTHTLGDMIRRLATGTALQLKLQARMLRGGIEWEPVGYLLLALAIVGLVIVGPRARRALWGLTFAEFIAFFGWMTPVWYLPHYTMPVVPTTLLSAWMAIGAGVRFISSQLPRLADGAPRWLGRLEPGVTAFAAALALASVTGLAWQIGRIEIPPAQEDAEVAALREWIAAHVGPGEPFVLGPERKYRMEWYATWQGDRFSLPEMNRVEELAAYLDEHQIRWLILTPRQIARRLDVFREWVVYHEPDGFLYLRPLPGWRVVDWDRLGERIDYVILKRNPGATSEPIILRETEEHRFSIPDEGQQPIDARFGGQIALRGYRVDRAKAAPGDQITVRLYWQRLARPQRAYTAFVHLITSEGTTILTQHDKPPRDGAYPTHEWLLDEVVIEDYTLSLPIDAPPGRYRLEVGWYDLDTGARLPVEVNGAGPVGDHLILPTEVQVEP